MRLARHVATRAKSSLFIVSRRYKFRIYMSLIPYLVGNSEWIYDKLNLTFVSPRASKFVYRASRAAERFRVLFESFLIFFSLAFLFCARHDVYSEPWSCSREQASGTFRQQRLIAQLASFLAIFSLVLACLQRQTPRGRDCHFHAIGGAVHSSSVRPGGHWCRCWISSGSTDSGAISGQPTLGIRSDRILGRFSWLRQCRFTEPSLRPSTS